MKLKEKREEILVVSESTVTCFIRYVVLFIEIYSS